MEMLLTDADALSTLHAEALLSSTASASSLGIAFERGHAAGSGCSCRAMMESLPSQIYAFPKRQTQLPFLNSLPR